MKLRMLTTAVLATTALTVPSSVGAAVTTLHIGKRSQDIGGYRPHMDPTLDSAIAFFGQPNSLRPAHELGEGCTVRYNRLGLTLDFLYLGARERGTTACDIPDRAALDRIVISGARARATWQTARGLRVGDSARKMRRLYPRTKRNRLYFGRTYVLTQPPALTATLSRAGRVSRLQVFPQYAGI